MLLISNDLNIVIARLNAFMQRLQQKTSTVVILFVIIRKRRNKRIRFARLLAVRGLSVAASAQLRIETRKNDLKHI